MPGSPPFQVKTRRVGDCAVLEIAGEFDLAARPAVQAALRTLESHPAVALLIDMRALEFIDSAGIGVLLAARRRCERAARPMTLVAARPVVRRTIALCGVEDLFTWVDASSLCDGIESSLRELPGIDQAR